jgi:hypothetical protein
MTQLQYFLGQQDAEHNILVEHGLLDQKDRSVKKYM